MNTETAIQVAPQGALQTQGDSLSTCHECGRRMEGSIGAAGLFWPTLCQECKDGADAALARQGVPSEL